MVTIDRRPPVRRPRRSNSLKDIGRLLSMATVAYESRDNRLRAHAAKLFDTDGNARSNYFKIQTANLFLRRFGVKLIANDRVLHLYEEWPGLDRRCVSGSILNPAIHPKCTNVLFPHRIAKRPSGSKAKGFQPGERPAVGWSTIGGIGEAWLDDGPAGDVLRHLKALALDIGAPVPRPAQAARLGVSRWTGTHGGATSEELWLATTSKKNLNRRLMALRDADPMASVPAAQKRYEIIPAPNIRSVGLLEIPRHSRLVLNGTPKGAAARELLAELAGSPRDSMVLDCEELDAEGRIEIRKYKHEAPRHIEFKM